MSKAIKKILITYGVVCALLFIITLFTAQDTIPFWEHVFYTMFMSIFITIGVYLIKGCAKYGVDLSANLPKDHDTGMISCQKCGYLGAGSGHCPRCGWNTVTKVKSSTDMISCQNCGYLGAGSGFCTRCGSNRVTRLSK